MQTTRRTWHSISGVIDNALTKMQLKTQPQGEATIDEEVDHYTLEGMKSDRELCSAACHYSFLIHVQGDEIGPRSGV